MLRLVSVLVLMLSLGGTVAQAGVLSKFKSGVAHKAGKVVAVGAIFVLSCGMMMSCDDMKVGQITDMLGDKGDDNTDPTVEAVIKIGMNYLGDRDPNALDGAELAVAQINAAGGVNGMLLELIAFDNMKNQTRSLEMTKAIIDEHGVVAFIGPEYSSHATLVGPVVTAAGIPMLSTTATNPSVATSGKFVYMVSFTDSFQGWLMAKFARENLGAQTAAILTKSEDVYSVGLSEIFQENFTLLSGNVVAQEFYPLKATDFTTQLTAIAAKNPDVLFIPGHAEVALAAKQARALGIEATLLGGDGWGGADLVKDGGDAVEGAFFSNHFYTIPTDGLSEDTLDFIANFIEMHGKRPISRSAAAYDAIRILADAIVQAGSLEGEALREAIAATTNYSGATAISHFTEEGYPIKNAVIETVKDGGVVFHMLVNP